MNTTKHIGLVATSLSLLLFVLGATSSARSYWNLESADHFWNARPHSVYPGAPAATALRLQHYRGNTSITLSSQVCLPTDCQPPPVGVSARWRYRTEPARLLSSGMLPKPPASAIVGFHYRLYRAAAADVRVLWLPDWAILLPLTLLPIRQLSRIARRTRRQDRLAFDLSPVARVF
jgi:hypothetical protein